MGASTVVDLRLVGFARDLPVAPLKRFYTVVWAGFWIQFVSGSLLLIGYPTKSLTNYDFYLKMVLIGAAMVVKWQLQKNVFGNPNLDDKAMAAKGKTLALVSLLLWLGVRVTALYANMIQNYWTHDRRFGSRRYEDDDNAMNIGDWLPVTLTFSACLQNNHHHFPNFLRTSHDCSEYDFGLLTVRVMKAMGLVKATTSGAQMPAGIALKDAGF